MMNNSTKKMSFWGASPKIFLFTIIFSIPVVILNILYKSVFEINFISGNALNILAVALLIIGIPLYINLGKKLKAAVAEGKLLTTGFFSICRNPLFAVVIFLLLPGILLFFKSWFLLLIPILQIICVEIFIGREEKNLETVFGQEYVVYKQKTPAVFPLIWKYKN